MRYETVVKRSDENMHEERVTAFTDDGAHMSHAGFKFRYSRYCDGYIKAMTTGSIGTDPEYRRAGCVRHMLETALSSAADKGAAVSFLHPFSFAYYRKFGYEKVSDHLIVEFPMFGLEHIPRFPDLVPLRKPEQIPDVLDIFDRFSKNRNIMFKRFDGGNYSLDPKESGRSTYIWYDADGAPASYVTYKGEKAFVVNHMESVCLNVLEFAYTSPESLYRILGFLRMFEGELDTIKIHNCAMAPELDFVLRRYTHTKYTKVPDIMGRVVDLPALLKANRYPGEHGHFVIKSVDTLPTVSGCFDVEYEKGVCEVKRIQDTDSYDLAAEPGPLTQLLYGYDQYNPETVKYMYGVELKTDAKDFFKAFPKRSNGLFEHF